MIFTASNVSGATKLFVDYYEILRIYFRYLIGKALTGAIPFDVPLSAM
jgi:hypothetical protein